LDSNFFSARESWSFLANHARVLLCIAPDPGARLRGIAARLSITERSASRPAWLARPRGARRGRAGY